MEIFTIPNISRDFKLVINSDNHVGSPDVNEEKIKEMVAYVQRTPYCGFVNIGDNIEAITPKDKRHNPELYTRYLTVRDQVERVIELFTPIKKQIVVIGQGNHENNIAIKYVMTAGSDIAKALGTRYGAWCYKLGFLDAKGQLMFKMYCTHGNNCARGQSDNYIRQIANEKVSLKNKFLRQKIDDAAICCMGHIHKMIIVDPRDNELSTYDDGHKIHQGYRYSPPLNVSHIHPDYRWYCSTGSMMKTYAEPGSGRITYGEVAMYEPAELGFLVVTIQDGKPVDIEKVIL